MSAPAEYAHEFGRNLKRLRIAAGLTQSQVAERANLTQPHYAALEAGRSSNGNPANPRLATLLHLASALSASPADLVADLTEDP